MCTINTTNYFYFSECEVEHMIVMTYANFKGGVGKTTNSVMTAYELAKKGYKTLVCDLDPQANATQLLRRTYGLQNNQKGLKIGSTMMVALSNENINEAIVKIMDNLYLLPSYSDFTEYPDFLELKYPAIEDNYKEKRIAYFKQQLDKVKDDYDFVIVDVPPTLSIYTDSAVYASNEVIIVLQTQQRSLDGAEAFFEYLQRTYDKYPSINFDILGVLAVLLKNNVGLDSQILNDAGKIFGYDLMFHMIIHHMERLKRYDRTGIADKDLSPSDFHDTKVHYTYLTLTDEILERLRQKGEIE